MARDEAKDDDDQLAIGDLAFVYSPEVKEFLEEQGGLQIDYQSNAWGGGFTIALRRGGGCC